MQTPGDLREETRLANGTCDPEHCSYEVELKALPRTEQGAELAHDRMDDYVEPAANGELRGVFPGLEPIATVQIVRWLPVVEDLIAILDRRVEGRENVDGSEDVEGTYRLNRGLVSSRL